MRVVALAVCMLILAFCQLPAKSTDHRSTYCTTCPRDSYGKIECNTSARRAAFAGSQFERISADLARALLDLK